jgi:hypothetical protein
MSAAHTTLEQLYGNLKSRSIGRRTRSIRRLSAGAKSEVAQEYQLELWVQEVVSQAASGPKAMALAQSGLALSGHT